MHIRLTLDRPLLMRAVAFASGLLVTSLIFGQTPSPAEVAKRFAGNWVEDQSKRQTGELRSLTFRQGANGLEELRGSYARPLLQPVRFGTAPYAVDGSKNTIVWKQLSGGRFERTIFESGKPVSTRHITVSADGKTLTELIESNLPNGTKLNETIVYRRTSGSGQTLEGVWKPQSYRSDTPQRIAIEASGSTLKVSSENGVTFALTFDGKTAPVTGPAVISGTTATGKVLNDHVIEIANARLGTSTSQTTWTLSTDGKTLTAKEMQLGPDANKEPSVAVFNKK